MKVIFRPLRQALFALTFPVTVTEVVLVLPLESTVLTGVAATLTLPLIFRGPLAAAPLAAVTATIATAPSAAAACIFLISFLSLAFGSLLLLLLLLLRTEQVRGEGGGPRASRGRNVLQAEQVLDGAEEGERVVGAGVGRSGSEELRDQQRPDGRPVHARCGLSEGDDQDAVTLVGRGGEDLRDPAREEPVGLGRTGIIDGGVTLGRLTGVAEVGRDEREVGGPALERTVEPVQRYVALLAAAQVQQRVEVDERVVPGGVAAPGVAGRRIGLAHVVCRIRRPRVRVNAGLRRAGRSGLPLGDRLRFAHVLHVGAPGEPGAEQLIRDVDRLRRIDAAVAGDVAAAVRLCARGELGVARALLRGGCVGGLATGHRDVVGQSGVHQERVAGEQLTLRPQGVGEIRHLRVRAERVVIAGAR